MPGVPAFSWLRLPAIVSPRLEAGAVSGVIDKKYERPVKSLDEKIMGDRLIKEGRND
ncbi:MAG: hypothetical protein ACRC8Y_24335 [Chroococcales cyanobacterium]